MNGLWKRRIPALLLTLVMIISLMPAALAEEPAAAPDAGSTTVTPRENDPDDTTGGGDGGNSGGAHSHSWGDWVTSKEATCTTPGLRVRTCRVAGCSESEEEEIRATGAHKWKFESTTATCGTDGIKTERCSTPGCNEEKTSDDPATGKHSWQDSGSPTAATCGQDGVQPQTCRECGATQNKTIPATNRHTWETKVITEAKCTTPGSKQDTCSVCGKIAEAVAIPSLGHTKPDANGKCTRCGEIIQTHTHQKKGGIQSNATHHWYECTGCSDRLEEERHGPADVGGKCPTCGYTLHTHSWAKDWTTNATSHWHACTGSSCTAKNQEAAHTFVNNICSVCKYVRSAGTFTVRFYNGTSVVNTQNVAQNGYPTLPSNPAKSGCVFRGWSATNPGNAPYTNASALVSPATIAISKATDYYAVFSVSATGKNATINAETNIGSTLWNQIRTNCSAFGMTAVTVRLSPGSSSYGTMYTGSSQTSSYAVTASDYTSSQISKMTFKAGSSKGNYALGYTATDASGYNKVSGTIYIASSATDAIAYSVSAGKSVSFNRRDFYNLCQDRIGGTLDYIVFSRPGSEYDDYGAVYSSSSSLSRSDLNGSYAYYDKSDAGRNDYYLDNLSFKADSKAKSGTLSLGFTAYNTRGERFSGTVEITVSGGAAKGDVAYNVDPGKEVDFDARDFNKAFQDRYGSTRTDLYYITFSAPSSYSSFRGIVRAGSTSLDRSDLNSYYFYYNSKDATGKNDYALDRLSFKADSNARDGDTITIPFRAYYGSGSRDYEDCNLVITIGKGTASKGDIDYEVAPGKSVDFRARDFNDFFREEYSGYTLSYVEFEQPSTSAFSKGTLYHNYGSSSSKAFTRSNLDDNSFYYDPSSKQYGIGDLTFVAESGFTDTVTLEFTAYGSGSRSVRGTLTIRSTASSDDGDITYKVAAGGSVALKRSDFNDFFREEYKGTVEYVVFSRPSSTSIFNNGTLYADYGASSQTSFSRTSLGGTHFYYNKSDMGKNDYYLDALTFVAGSGFKDAITLEFTAYGEDDDDYVEGTLVIKADGTAATSNYAGNIRYTTTTGTNVQINANDLARYYKQAYPSYTLQYVVFSGVPATGSLYYNYYNASSYGTTSRTQITSANCTRQSFYFSPSSTSQYALTELTYVPSGANYCAAIPFTAYGTSGTSITGTILVSVSRSAVAEVYGVTPRNTAVNFPASQVYSAVSSATGSALSGIQLLGLPAVTAGTLYYGTGSTRADTRTVYNYSSGANLMSQLRFVPNAGFTGSVEIPYVALNASGTALASGVFSLGVLNAQKKFSDVNSATWCYKYVAELSDKNVISGYGDGSFKPNNTVTYGAALKLIMLAAGYPEQAPTGKNVFSGYLKKAQEDGLVTRSNVNLSTPITRLQVAQIAAGALKLSTSGLSSVKPFTDTSDVYVQALYNAGIVGGYFSNGVSTYRPSSTLTRGQISAIVWRMNEYRK